jgi:hypothetical protein
MHNYLRKANELLESGRLPRNQFHLVLWRHDEWCAHQKGTGECNCDPDWEILTDSFFGRNGRGPTDA